MLGFWRGRKISNLIWIFFTFINFFAFLLSIYFFSSTDKFLTGVILFSTATFINYLITLISSWKIINSPNREISFISFFLFIFVLLPFLGIFLYFLFGFDIVSTKNKNDYSDFYSRYKQYELNNFLINNKNNISNVFLYNFAKHQIPVYENIDISILDDAYSTLSEITFLINKAKKHIHMEFYMFGDGLIFEHIFQLLKSKIQQGVEVRLIIDYVGNIGRLGKKSLKRLKSIGVQVRIFNSFFRFNHLWWQFRTHKKIIVVDNEYSIFGSCNIADEYFSITKKYFQTTELSAKLRGPIVNSINVLFMIHWDLCNSKKKINIPEFSLEECENYFQISKESASNERENIAQFLDNSPIGDGFILRDNLMQLIFEAKKKIIISSPYFYPPQELLNALKLAKSSGILVKILVPKNPDLINFFNTLNRQNFGDLIFHGLEIYEYFGFNHEKILIIDDEIVYFGSYNWDYRSLYLNFENALLIKCRKTAEIMLKFMDKQFQNSHKITLQDLSRSRYPVTFATFIKLFKPFL